MSIITTATDRNQQAASGKNVLLGNFRKVFDARADGAIKVGQCFMPVAEKRLGQHEHLYLEGEKQKHVFQIIEGVVGVYKMLPDGRRGISKFYYPGELIGLDEPGYFNSHAEALSESRVRYIPLKTIDTLIVDEPGFGRALLSLVTDELKDAREQLLSLGRKSALEKVASFFYDIHSKSECPAIGATQETVHLPMTRNEIADYLGLTIETVSRSITKLKVAKVIQPESRTQFLVLDADKLVEIAEGAREAAPITHSGKKAA